MKQYESDDHAFKYPSGPRRNTDQLHEKQYISRYGNTNIISGADTTPKTL